MNKVVFQGRNYPVSESFWEDVSKSGVTPLLYEFVGGTARAVPLTREQFLTAFPKERVAGWVWSPHKSFTVLTEALAETERTKATELFQVAVLFALRVIAEYIEARTGAQGKTRLLAEPSFAVFCHPEAADGSPHWHVHIYMAPNVWCPDLQKSFATNGRQLYQLRELFDAAAGAKLSEGFRNEFGTRIALDGPRREPVLRDVSVGVCQAVAFRTKDIATYLRERNLPNHPVPRHWAARATRPKSRNTASRQADFFDTLKRHSFHAHEVTNRARPLSREQDQDARRQIQAFAVVRNEADQLSAKEGTFAKPDLVARSLKALAGRRTPEAILDAVDKVVRSPNLFHLTPITKVDRKPRYTTPACRPAWEKVFSQLRDEGQAAGNARANHKSGPNSQSRARSFTQRTESPQPKSVSSTAIVEKLIGPTGLGAAVSHESGKVVRAATDAFTRAGRPVYRVNGEGGREAWNSLARLLREHSRTPRREAHRAALRAALRPNFRTLDATLSYAQAVYRAVRRPKHRLERRSLVIVEHTGLANPAHVDNLLQLVKRARAKVLLADDGVLNPEMVKAAQRARLNQYRARRPEHGQTQDQTR